MCRRSRWTGLSATCGRTGPDKVENASWKGKPAHEPSAAAQALPAAGRFAAPPPAGREPTPVRRLTALTAALPVWCKDESGYGEGGWGGNKIRKLEWILPDARRRGAHTLLTVGGIGTNWGLAAALYAGEQGLATALALIDQPVDDHVRAQLARLRRSGATLHFTRTKRRTVAAAPWLFLRHSSGGRLPYFLPAGGSTPVGTLGYVEAAFELAAQVASGPLPEPSHVVTAVGSGGTAAGLALGLRLAGLRSRVVGVVVNDTLRLDDRPSSRWPTGRNACSAGGADVHGPVLTGRT